MEADFQACGDMLLPLMAKHQSRRERKFGSWRFHSGKLPICPYRSRTMTHSQNDNGSLRMSEERSRFPGEKMLALSFEACSALALNNRSESRNDIWS